jgi:hypothetical protein
VQLHHEREIARILVSQPVLVNCIPSFNEAILPRNSSPTLSVPVAPAGNAAPSSKRTHATGTAVADAAASSSGKQVVQKQANSFFMEHLSGP